eukprot:CAMPEP_0173457134 /NCGR_PEP_ID=MMETSP1357-20121228/57232_1 /TAXON_ID=77926 /ORGANISM="Hemiselmis rufescens, Strain PCC563" /LENGTH=32 /DNA_ID= /DNA_START= /DNA_END= /DNA_ORIENTATION=
MSTVSSTLTLRDHSGEGTARERARSKSMETQW